MRSYSLQGLVRWIFLKLRKKELMIEGSCNGCGKCCNKINLNSSKGWVRTEEEFQRVCSLYPKYERFNVLGKDSQGFLQFSCSWVTKEGLCKDYQKRLEICKRFPSKSLHFCGGGLPQGCGYSIATVTPFSKVLEKEVKNCEKEDPGS